MWRRRVLLIVDSQVHTWAASTIERPWPANTVPHREVPIGTDDLLLEMNQAHVDRAILVPPSWEGGRNDLALAAAQKYPNRFAVMGRIPMTRIAGAQGELIDWCKQQGMLGLRLAFNNHNATSLFESGQLNWVWEEAESAGIPIMILVWHANVYFINQIAIKYPNLKIVMDHFSLNSSLRDGLAFENFDQLLAIAKCKNIAVKASALPCYTNDIYPYRSLHQYVKKAYDAFGPQRMFWGTDLSRSPISYRQQVLMFTEEMPFLSTEDLTWIMGRGICEWLKWDL